MSDGDETPIRLNKYLASTGAGSRRRCDEMIAEGLVEVNGRVVRELGTKIDPGRDRIRISGEGARRENNAYYIVFKPVGYVSSSKRQGKDPTVLELLKKNVRARIYPVGRLDKDSEGLMILTNDGALANLLTHPRYGVPKTYLVRAYGSLEPKKVRALRQGIKIDGQTTGPSAVNVIKAGRKVVKLSITLKEGRNREIRRMLSAVGCGVIDLKRVRIGPLTLGKMRPGEYRELKPKEVAALYRAGDEARDKNARAPRKREQGSTAPPAADRK